MFFLVLKYEFVEEFDECWSEFEKEMRSTNKAAQSAEKEKLAKAEAKKKAKAEAGKKKDEKETSNPIA